MSYLLIWLCLMIFFIKNIFLFNQIIIEIDTHIKSIIKIKYYVMLYVLEKKYYYFMWKSSKSQTIFKQIINLKFKR
jgi:hypothetical protein